MAAMRTGGWLAGEASSKQEKGLMDTGNSVVIAGGKVYKSIKW